jgi:Na+-exporting ATPase
MPREGKKQEQGTAHVSGQANVSLMGLPHTLSIDQIASEIGANLIDGLSAAEAQARLDTYGPNELDDDPGVSPVKILIRQLANAMTLVKHTTRQYYMPRFSDPTL